MSVITSIARDEQALGDRYAVCGHPSHDIAATIDTMHADPQFAAEVAAFTAARDAEWAAEMERLDAAAENRKAEREPVIVRSIYTATRGRFEASVSIDGKRHRLGFHKTEGQANAAIDRYLRGLFPRRYRVA